MDLDISAATKFSISNPALYIAAVLGGALLLRLLLAMLAGIMHNHRAGGDWGYYSSVVRQNLRGTRPRPDADEKSKIEGQIPDWQKFSDYWYPFIIGAFELLFYPVLMVTGSWAAIGGWIALKTISQWGVWSTDRAVFNLFLIGTLANLSIAFFFLTRFVTSTG
jgi:hypothetical protein